MAELGLARPFTLEELVAATGRRRGRPVTVVEEHLGALDAMPCGIWVPLPEADVIFVEEKTSPAHRQHICLHELAHILCEHAGAGAAMVPADLLRLLPALAPEKVASVLARTSYDSEQEREAEAMATVLGRFLALGNAAPGAVAEDEVLGELAKLFHLET